MFLAPDPHSPRSPRAAALGRVLGVVLAALALALALSSCAKNKNTLVPNLPPETTVFVQGAVDTVNHVVHLYWFGTDADGFVVAFEVRFKNPADPADTAWIRTTKRDSIFTIFTPAGSTSPEFEVRAIDDHGLADPDPATQLFHFSNQPPVVVIDFYPQPHDTTYASLTLSWSATDPDGESTKMRFRVWLDGNEANPRITDKTTYTIPTEDFEVSGVVASGPRTVNVQPIDDGGLAGAVVSRQWVVRPASPADPSRGRLLLIDDVFTTNIQNTRTDSLWTNAVTRNLPAGTYSILKLQTTQPFRSALDAQQTFSQFDAVIWYRGNESSFSQTLHDVQYGIGTAIEAGHSFAIEGTNLVEGAVDRGPLTAQFVSRYFDTDFLYKHFDETAQDSSVVWDVIGGDVLRSTVYQDSLRFAGIFAGLRGFAVKDTHEVVMWARVGQALTEPHDYDIPVALSVTQPSGARAIILAFPVFTTSVSIPEFPQRATALLNNVVRSVSGTRPSGLRARR